MRRLSFAGLSLILAASLLGVGGVAPVQAGGTVSTCDEASLLAALAGGGTVTFACSGTITLTSATLTISANTIIDGSGQAVTISGGNTLRVFIINSGISLTLRNIAIANGNSSAANGGAILNNGGSLNVVNSTIANSTAAAASGGGIFNNGGTVNLANATIAGNTAVSGGSGVANSAGTVNVKNTIIANNGVAADVSGTFSSLGYNLVEDITGCTSSCGFTITGDQTGSSADLDPFNGFVFPLNTAAPVSPAINAGNTAGCTDPNNTAITTDQRGAGFPRPRSGRCDIGAFEVQSNAQPVANPATITLNEDTPFAGTLTASDADPNPVFTFAIVSNGTRGTATIGSPSTGAFTYIPNTNENGVDFFTFKVNDTEVDSTTATVTVNITPVNDQPTLNPIGNTSASVGGLSQTITLTGIGSGASNENQTLGFTTIGACMGGVASSNPAVANPTITYTSPLSTASLTFTPGTAGTTTITVNLCDDGGTTNGGVDRITRTFTITVAQATETFTPSATFTSSNTPTPTATSSPGPTSTPTASPNPSTTLTATATPAPKIPLFTSIPPTFGPNLTLTAGANATQTSVAATIAAAVPTLTPDVAQTQTSIAITNATVTATPTVPPSPTVIPTFVFPSETGAISISQSIGRAGGRFTCGIWVIEAAKDAVPESSTIHCNTVSRDSASVPALPSNVRGFWQVVDIKITASNGEPITTFTQPLKACAYYSESYKEAAGGDAARFTIYTASESAPWQPLVTTPDPSTARVCSTPDHLSLFLLGAQPTSLATRAGPWGIVGLVAIAAGIILLVVVVVVVIAVLRSRRPQEEAKA